MSQPYIPSNDAAFRDWLLNFATLIAADPTRYGLTAADATVIQGYSDDFDAAYQTAVAPSTRTVVTVAQKDAIRAAANESVRIFAQMIKVNQGVTNEDKIALGIHVDDPTPSPIPAPTSSPLLMLVSSFSGVHQLRYADENTPASRRKPAGVIQMQLNMAVAPGPVVDPTVARFFGLFTKQPILVEHSPENAAQTATYFARWVTRTGKFGPWSLPQSMTIAFAGPAAGGITGGGTSATTGGRETIKIAA